MDEYLRVPEPPRCTPAQIRAAVRVVAAHARDADDLRLLLDRLGIDRPQPPEVPRLPRLPCTKQSWQDFRTGKTGPRFPPTCKRCGSVFKDWHACHIPP